jgi:hypothetical protein
MTNVPVFAGNVRIASACTTHEHQPSPVFSNNKYQPVTTEYHVIISNTVVSYYCNIVITASLYFTE